MSQAPYHCNKPERNAPCPCGKRNSFGPVKYRRCCGRGVKAPRTPTTPVIEFLRKAIAKARDDGFEEFISGGALGVDQWAAEVVLELGLKLVIALPFAKYGENWPVESQAHLAFLKSKASKVEIVCEGEYFENGKAQTWKNHERNKWMMNNSELIIAVWDGKPEGGTASAVKGGKKAGKAFIRFNPDTEAEEPVV